MLIELGTWVVDTAGKLGPLAVAIAVFETNRRQARWGNAVAVRTAAVEDQKMRLAMLDRRLVVINHIRHARDQLTPTQRSGDPMMAVLDALNEAQLVFEDEQRIDIEKCFQSIVSYQTRYVGLFEDLKGAELMEAVNIYQDCVGRISKVLYELQQATRIQIIPPLGLPDE